MPFTTRTHIDKARARALGRFRELPNVQTLIDVLVEPLQEIEDAVLDIMGKTLDNATGVWLERYGAIVNRPKLSTWTDTEYRRRIRLRIQALACQGTSPEMLALAQALRPTGETVDATYEPAWPAGYKLRIPNVPTADRDEAVALLAIATPTGVRGTVLFWMTANPPFTYGATPGSTYGYGAGAYVKSSIITGT